jgi:hypothetical protein
MLPLTKRLGLIAALGAVALVMAADVAHAQNTNTNTMTNTFTTNSGGIRVGPGVLLNNFRYNPMINNPYNPSTTPGYTCYGYCPAGSYSGGCYGSSYGYGYTYCQDPFNGYLTGAASVITSQAQFVTARRQADILKEQARQAAVDTQRKIYEEWKYEKNDQPTLEQIRRDAWEQAYKRSVFHPPLNDIWTADALNRIFDHAARIQNRGIAGTRIAVDEDSLKHINFSTGVAGNIGALKDKGKLNWPAVLERNDFAPERTRFSQLAADAVRQGGDNNKVESAVLRDMERDLDSLDQKLTDRIRDISPDDYIAGKHYLQELKQAVRILKRPDVADYINGKYNVRGGTIGELIQNMANAGVRFAPARSGEEAAYNSLYKSLLTYDLSLAEKSMETTNGTPNNR